MNDTQKALAIIGWGVMSILLFVGGISVGSSDIAAAGAFGLVFLILILIGTGLIGVREEPEWKWRRRAELTNKTLEEKLPEWNEEQSRLGRPADREDLKKITDKFGFTLHGDFNYSVKRDYSGIAYVSGYFKIETHKSIEELREMGINTLRDILGDYFPYFDCEAITYRNFKDCYFPYDEYRAMRENPEDVNEDINNIVYYIYYSTNTHNTTVEWNKDYIIMILENHKGEFGYSRPEYIIHRESGIRTCKKDELTANEKYFIERTREHYKNGLSHYKINKFDDYSCYYYSGNRPIFLR